jgi:hypothetical protein
MQHGCWTFFVRKPRPTSFKGGRIIGLFLNICCVILHTKITCGQLGFGLAFPRLAPKTRSTAIPRSIDISASNWRGRSPTLCSWVGKIAMFCPEFMAQLLQYGGLPCGFRSGRTRRRIDSACRHPPCRSPHERTFPTVKEWLIVNPPTSTPYTQ